jgi:hypothetical protein
MFSQHSVMFWASTSDGTSSLPIMAVDWFSFFPSGVTNLLARVYDQHTNMQHVEELVAAPCTPPVRPVLETGQTGVAGLNWRRTFERRSSRILSERHT